MPRFHVPDPLQPGAHLALPAGAARHVQVLRLQPGAEITLFDGQGGECAAVVERIGRSDVQVQVGAHRAVEREAARAVHLVVGMPANDRMDWLVEKATELGATSIQPLVTERSVLRLAGERADKKRLHWDAIAVAACEQCGRNRVPRVHPVQTLTAWLAQTDPTRDAADRRVLSLRDAAATTAATTTAAPATPLAATAKTATATETARAKPPETSAETAEVGAATALIAATAFRSSSNNATSHGPTGRFDTNATRPVWIVGGPEGGLTNREEDALIAAGFVPMSLGTRVLRAETAALAVLAALVTPAKGC